MAKLTKREALEKARTKRLNKIYGKQYAELIAKARRFSKSGEKDISYQNIAARIKIAQRELQMQGKTATRAAAIKAVEYSATFMSRDERYVKAIRDNMSLSDKNTLRKRLSEVNKTPYKQTKINWEEFHYNEAVKGLVHASGSIKVYIKHGANSTEEDFVVVE